MFKTCFRCTASSQIVCCRLGYKQDSSTSTSLLSYDFVYYGAYLTLKSLGMTGD